MKIAPALAVTAFILLLGAGCSKNTRVTEEITSKPNEPIKQANTQQSVTITTPEAMPSYAMNEVNAHATSTDCWIVVQDKVYDITTYIRKNPDKKNILEGCGKDAIALIPSIAAADPAFKDSLPDYEFGLLAK